MLALYRAGRQAEALEVYKETRRTSVERLGIEPTPRLRELEQAILAQDPELDAGLRRIRPHQALRRRPRRIVVGFALVGIAAIAATAGAFLARGESAAVVAPSGSVAVVDPRTARVVDMVEVGAEPVAIVSGHDALWVANAESDTVSRIDPATREVTATVGVASPVDLAVGPDAIWVASGIDGTVSRIDPESNDVVATIDLGGPDPFVPQTVHGVSAGFGGVWAAVSGPKLIRIDAAENRVARSIDVGTDQLAVAVGHGAVWVVTPEKLLRLEPTTGAITAELSITSRSGIPSDVAVADDGVLVLAGDMWLVDPESTSLERTFSLGSFAGIADEPGPGLWAVTSGETSESVLARWDPDSEGPLDPVHPGSRSTATAVAGGAVWVTIGEPED